MKKELKDYLHFYLGCDLINENYPNEIFELVGISKPYKSNDTTFARMDIRPKNKGFRNIFISDTNLNKLKLILRPLSDMTKEEKEWLGEHENFVDNYKQNAESELIIEWDAEKTVYLLSKNFDLFGLIEAGLAIDAKTLK